MFKIYYVHFLQMIDNNFLKKHEVNIENLSNVLAIKSWIMFRYLIESEAIN